MQESAKLFYAGAIPVRNSISEIIMKKLIVWASGEVGESQQTVNLSPMAE